MDNYKLIYLISMLLKNCCISVSLQVTVTLVMKLTQKLSIQQDIYPLQIHKFRYYQINQIYFISSFNSFGLKILAL